MQPVQSGAQQILETPRDERPASLTDEIVHNVIRNEHHKTFTLGTKEFERKDLAYDDYIQFCSLITPLIEKIFSAAKPKVSIEGPNGPELDFDFDTSVIDAKTLVQMGAEALPLLAWLCCRQSDPSISIVDIKKLCGGKPWPLLTIVFQQIKHNKIVEDLCGFFPQMGELASELVPDLAAALTKLKS